MDFPLEPGIFIVFSASSPPPNLPCMYPDIASDVSARVPVNAKYSFLSSAPSVQPVGGFTPRFSE